MAAALVPVLAKSLHVSDHINWLRSRFHFSFAGHEYPDRNRNQYSSLRVWNDDVVKQDNGFGTHPHQNMEILSYILTGELTHQDSMGSKESLGRGCVQFMSAGSGVMHSEVNESPSEPVHFFQVWIVPEQRNVKPRYGSRKFTREQRLNTLHHFVYPLTELPNGEESDVGPIGMYQDVHFYCSEIEPGHSVEFAVANNRQLYLVNAEGTLNVQVNDENVQLSTGDAVEVNQRAQQQLRVVFSAPAEAAQPALFVFVDLKHA